MDDEQTAPPPLWKGGRHAERIGSLLLRKIGSVLLVWVCFTGVASADAVTDAKKALEVWDPVSVEMRQSSLIVVAKERRVTAKIYNAMIYAGICLWAGTGRVELSGVKEVVILNRFRASGWVFEGGAEECKRMANVPFSKVNLMIAGQTHMYACTSGRGCKY